MKRLMEKTVFCGLVTAWRLATVPTSRSPPLVKATTDGVVRPPSAFSITVGSPPSSTAIQLLVVPRSIPIVFPMFLSAPLRLQKSESESSRSAWPRRGVRDERQRRASKGGRGSFSVCGRLSAGGVQLGAAQQPPDDTRPPQTSQPPPLSPQPNENALGHIRCSAHAPHAGLRA